MRLTGSRFNDIRFIEGLLEGHPVAQKQFPALAWSLHLLNGVLLAEVYAAICKRFLPGPDWFKGVLFGELFVLAIWGATPLADKYHPMIQSGALPRLSNRTLLLQNLAVHLSKAPYKNCKTASASALDIPAGRPPKRSTRDCVLANTLTSPWKSRPSLPVVYPKSLRSQSNTYSLQPVERSADHHITCEKNTLSQGDQKSKNRGFAPSLPIAHPFHLADCHNALQTKTL